MIKTTIYTCGDQTVGFQVEDHAGYAEEGEDIVCASVSMLVINTINALDQFTDDDFTVESDPENAVIKLQFNGDISHDARLLIDTMILGLESLEDNSDYEPFIDIIFKEVQLR